MRYNPVTFLSTTGLDRDVLLVLLGTDNLATGTMAAWFADHAGDVASIGLDEDPATVGDQFARVHTDLPVEVWQWTCAAWIEVQRGIRIEAHVDAEGRSLTEAVAADVAAVWVRVSSAEAIAIPEETPLDAWTDEHPELPGDNAIEAFRVRWTSTFGRVPTADEVAAFRKVALEACFVAAPCNDRAA